MTNPTRRPERAAHDEQEPANDPEPVSTVRAQGSPCLRLPIGGPVCAVEQRSAAVFEHEVS